MARPWKPVPALKATAAVHGAAALGTLAVPAAWPWALGAVAVNHAVLTLAGLLPRSTLLGPNLTRLPHAAAARREVALTVDDGPDPDVTPRVLDLLDAAGIQASFFCIGWRARTYPGLCREIVARGHRVENHSDSHSLVFSTFGPRRIEAEIAAAQATLADITGEAPRFFRAPAGLRNPFLDPVLVALDLRLAAWTRRGYDTREARPRVVLGRLVRNLGAGDILLLHDGHAARTPEGLPVVLAVLPPLLRMLDERGLKPVTLADALA
ncbi:MAG: polysaccharide deacetylase family protein [Betaproteobacteria bacterium]|nr:polysaccharide deacetylase family protein [Betaproteobacteria bacterium]